jgi:hypothetical protein
MSDLSSTIENTIGRNCGVVSDILTKVFLKCAVLTLSKTLKITSGNFGVFVSFFCERQILPVVFARPLETGATGG